MNSAIILFLYIGVGTVLFSHVWVSSTTFKPFFLQVMGYRAPGMTYISGALYMFSAYLLYRARCDHVGSLVKGTSRINARICSFIPVLFFLQLPLMYPWYLAWLIPFLLLIKVPETKKLFQISLLILVFTKTMTYGTYNFPNYSYPSELVWRANLSNKDSWSTVCTIPNCSITFHDQGLNMQFSLEDGELDEPPRIAFISQFPSVEWREGEKMTLKIANPGVQFYRIVVILRGTNIMGERIRIRFQDTSSRFFWTSNNVSMMVFSLDYLYSDNDGILQQMVSFFEIRLIFDSFSSVYSSDYDITVIDLAIHDSNKYLF